MKIIGGFFIYLLSPTSDNALGTIKALAANMEESHLKAAHEHLDKIYREKVYAGNTHKRR
jgi:hypothetical protein